MSTDAETIASVENAFGEIERPDHFTDYLHCEECLEHNGTLSSKPRDALARQDLGTLGWNPITFCHPAAQAYLFPRLAREVLASPDDYYGWYGPELLSLLYRPLGENDFGKFCNAKQRASVLALLEHIIATRAELAESYFYAEELLNCHEQWTNLRDTT